MSDSALKKSPKPMPSASEQIIRKSTSKGQITLGAKHAGKQFMIETLDTGEVVLTPVSVIPDRNKVFFTEESKDRIRRFDARFKEREGMEPVDADEILKKIAEQKGYE